MTSIIPPSLVEKLGLNAPAPAPGAVFNFTISVDAIDAQQAARFLKGAGYDFALLFQKLKRDGK